LRTLSLIETYWLKSISSFEEQPKRRDNKMI